MNRYGVLFLVFILLSVTTLFYVEAQTSDSDVCPAFVDEALVAVGDYCDSLDRNSACYGHTQVDASFNSENVVSSFSNPSDRIELASLQTIHTAPLDVESGRWGVALLNTRANLPNTAAGQNVVMMLVGDATIENRVAPQDIMYTGETVPMTTLFNANLRDNPSLESLVIDSVIAQTALFADMLSTDGAWVRVAREDGSIAWVSRDIVQIAPEHAENLPSPDPMGMSPMQAFYFTGGLGQAGCDRASGTVYIQGPNNIRVNLNVNGAQVEIGSTVALSYTEDNALQFATLSGTVYIENVAVPAGFFVTAEVDGSGTVLPQTWRAPQVMNQSMRDRYALGESIPSNLLHYQVDIPETVVTYNGANTTGTNTNIGNNNGVPSNNNSGNTGNGACNCNGNTDTNAGNNADNGGNTDNGGNVGNGGNNAGNGGNVGNGGNNAGNTGNGGNNGGNGCNGNGNCNGNVNGNGNCNGVGNPNCNGNNGNGNGNNGNGNGNGNGNNGNGNGNGNNGNGNG